eukprot:3266964-Rhodomonas_salina.3
MPRTDLSMTGTDRRVCVSGVASVCMPMSGTDLRVVMPASAMSGTDLRMSGADLCLVLPGCRALRRCARRTYRFNPIPAYPYSPAPIFSHPIPPVLLPGDILPEALPP